MITEQILAAGEQKSKVTRISNCRLITSHIYDPHKLNTQKNNYGQVTEVYLIQSPRNLLGHKMPPKNSPEKQET